MKFWGGQPRSVEWLEHASDARITMKGVRCSSLPILTPYAHRFPSERGLPVGYFCFPKKTTRLGVREISVRFFLKIDKVVQPSGWDMAMRLAVLAACASLPLRTRALDNGLGLTPQVGFARRRANFIVVICIQ